MAKNRTTTPLPTIDTPQDFPSIWELLSELSRVPGPPGPIGPAGVPGPQGTPGTPGAPGPVSLTVGTTTTGAAGSAASVVNAGTSSALVLNFTVPQGATGATGTPGASAVTSVAGRTGAIVLAKGDVSLGNVDNTSDVNKPISTATQTALNAKALQTDVDLKQNLSAKNVANGYCGLGADGKVAAAQLPASGASAITFKDVKGIAAPNSGTGETTAWSFTIPANVFDVDGRTLDMEIFYVLGSTTSNKTFRIKIGSSVVVIASFGVTNDAPVYLKAHIVRNSSNSFSIGYYLSVGVGAWFETGNSTLGSQNFAAGITINVTVQGPSSSQCTFQNGRAFIL